MSNIHYFQRYHQKENVATNNTLLLFSRLYNESSNKFIDFINSLLGEELNSHLELINFEQQKKNGNSIPDGSITQNSFKIVIETKMDSAKNFKNSQLLNHLNSFNNEDQKILLTLSPTKMKHEQFKDLTEIIKEKDKSINLINTTFRDIVLVFRDTINEYDTTLIAIIDDYEEYCRSSGLITDNASRLRIIPCGNSYNLNMKYNIYYMPSSRNVGEHGYIGIYHDKKVIGIGKVKKRVNVTVENQKILKSSEDLNEDETNRIQNIITDSYKELDWDLGSCEYEYTIVDKFYETNYIKTSPGGIQGHRFQDLKGILKDNLDKKETLPTVEIIASLLSKKEWK